MAVKEEVTLPSQRICTRCKFVSSQEICKACVLLEGLNKGLPKLGIGKSSKAKKMLDEYNAKQKQNNLLKEAAKQPDNVDQNTENICQTNLKNCKSGLCTNKRNGLIKNDTNTEPNKKECNNQCSGNCERTKVKSVDNSKVNDLLETYAINESVDKINTDTSGNSINAADEEFNTSDNEDVGQVEQEDDTCSASCGKMGSLHIGF